MVVNECKEGVVSIKCIQYECGALGEQKSRITGGSRVQKDQMPSLALVYSGNTGMKCTATIVAPRWALASYSCIIGQTEFINGRGTELSWTLFSGSSEFDESVNNTNVQTVHVKQIVVYPQAKYKRFLYTGDFVLLELQNSLQFNMAVSASCLTRNTIEDESMCLTAGWGVQNPGKPIQEQYLRYLTTPIIDSSECNSTNYYAGSLPDNTICSSLASNQTTCYNDEGAPLMCYSSKTNVWEVQGVLSYHGNCGRRPQPVIYNSLSNKVINWITNTIGNNRMFRQT
jgi:hypothetical protein